MEQFAGTAEPGTATGEVVAVCRAPGHRFSKAPGREILREEGVGVDGDAHAGATVQHLSRMRVDPTQPNQRQVQLLHEEIFDELAAGGFHVGPGDLMAVVECGGVVRPGDHIRVQPPVGKHVPLAVA